MLEVSLRGRKGGSSLNAPQLPEVPERDSKTYDDTSEGEIGLLDSVLESDPPIIELPNKTLP